MTYCVNQYSDLGVYCFRIETSFRVKTSKINGMHVRIQYTGALVFLDSFDSHKYAKYPVFCH